jgi:flavin reductase (DIM6/NTAB) family NADH-FMN oxidoreductase RutF
VTTASPPAPRVGASRLDGDFTVDWTPGTLEQGKISLGLTVDSDTFKAAMRTLAAGVVIVTTFVEDRPWGLTISSCTSLTLEPPQILVSLRESTTSAQQIRASGRFGVSILSAAQRALAERGAAVGTPKFMDDLCATGEQTGLESPMVAGALFHLDCSLTVVHMVADHCLLVGSVTRARAPARSEDGSPLMYFDRSFWALGTQL